MDMCCPTDAPKASERHPHMQARAEAKGLGPSAPPPRDYGTLDDVPEFALRGVGQLYAVLFQRFERYQGVVFHGERTLGWHSAGYWGGQLFLPSQQVLQVRFWPRTLLDDEAPKLVKIATKVAGTHGPAHVAFFIGFQTASFSQGCSILPADKTIEISETLPTRAVGCKGLHIFLASLFKRHNVPQTSGEGVSCGKFDPYGNEAVRATSFSVYKGDRNFDKLMSHTNCNAATAGTSVLSIAGEIANVRIEPQQTRVCHPISSKKWKDTAAFHKNAILNSERGEDAGNEAIAAALIIVDLLSAEGLVQLRVDPFFRGALPDRMQGPHGMALAIAMAVNVAINWDAPHLKLPRPSAADVAANERLRHLLQTAHFGPLPGVEGAHWCIDVVMRGAHHAASPEMEALKKARNIPKGAFCLLGDQLCFWQRVGQRLITSHFGLGAIKHREFAHWDHTQGTAWRVRDPLAVARDRELGKRCFPEGINDSTVELAGSIGERKSGLLKLLMDVERWLRTGTYEGKDLPPSGTPTQIAQHMHWIRVVLGDLMAPTMVQDFVAHLWGRDGVTAKVEKEMTLPETDAVEKRRVAEMREHFHLGAMGAAIVDCKDLLMKGPAKHFEYTCGAYVASASQTAPCTDCGAEVHVIQGVMLANDQGSCTACSARRCLPCMDAYCKAIQVSTSQRIGKSCKRCFADPAWITVERTHEQMRIQVGPRFPAQTDTPLESAGPHLRRVVGATGDRGGRKKKK